MEIIKEGPVLHSHERSKLQHYDCQAGHRPNLRDAHIVSYNHLNLARFLTLSKKWIMEDSQLQEIQLRGRRLSANRRRSPSTIESSRRSTEHLPGDGVGTSCFGDFESLTFPPIDSQKCQLRASSNQASGALTLSLYPNNILRGICKIPSICLVRKPPTAPATLIDVAADPKVSLHPDPEYYKRVATVHEKGAYGSVGYRSPWSDAESKKLLLRTHTTASSTHMLYKLAARCRGETIEGDEKTFTHGAKSTFGPGVTDDGFRPAKLFSIDRVFRNETMDATHLAEFHQVEGVVADKGLTLADLIGKLYPFLLVPLSQHLNRIHARLLLQDGYGTSPLQAGI